MILQQVASTAARFRPITKIRDRLQARLRRGVPGFNRVNFTTQCMLLITDSASAPLMRVASGRQHAAKDTPSVPRRKEDLQFCPEIRLSGTSNAQTATAMTVDSLPRTTNGTAAPDAPLPSTRFSRSRQMGDCLRRELLYTEKRPRDCTFAQLEVVPPQELLEIFNK